MIDEMGALGIAPDGCEEAEEMLKYFFVNGTAG